MAAIVGTGDYTCEVAGSRAKLPPGRSPKAIGAAGVDRNDNVHIPSRGEDPMIVFDRNGNFLKSCGEGMFRRAAS